MAKNSIFAGGIPLCHTAGMCMPTVILTESNSIYVPLELIHKLGLVPGDSLFVEVVNGELVARPVLPEVYRSRNRL